jgi:hypothetical protein
MPEAYNKEQPKGQCQQFKHLRNMGYQENEAAQTGNPHPNISTT